MKGVLHGDPTEQVRFGDRVENRLHLRYVAVEDALHLIEQLVIANAQLQTAVYECRYHRRRPGRPAALQVAAVQQVMNLVVEQLVLTVGQLRLGEDRRNGRQIVLDVDAVDPVVFLQMIDEQFIVGER